MKLPYNQFQFITKRRRFVATVWKKYYSIKSKAKKEKLKDEDKFFLRQVREGLRVPEMEVTVLHKPSKISTTSVVRELKFDRKKLIEKLLNKVREQRIEKRKLQTVFKQFDGANYKVIGGVMEKPNLINEIAKHTTTNDPYSHKKPRHKNKNYIGIEVEFNETRGVSQDAIAQALKAAGMARYVNVTTDGSCGWEVRVLLPEDDFETPITKILKVIKDLGHTADARCGTHVHFDMRNRDVKLVYENLFKSQKLLRKFVTQNRKRNRYCQMNKADTFDKQLSLGDRYYSLNVEAYNRHRTLEVRMHQGTLNADELLPWIKLLLKIVNYKTAIDGKVNTLKQARNQFQLDETLNKHLEQRIVTMFKKAVVAG